VTCETGYAILKSKGRGRVCHQRIRGHFGEEYFKSLSCTGWGWQPNQNNWTHQQKQTNGTDKFSVKCAPTWNIFALFPRKV